MGTRLVYNCVYKCKQLFMKQAPDPGSLRELLSIIPLNSNSRFICEPAKNSVPKWSFSESYEDSV